MRMRRVGEPDAALDARLQTLSSRVVCLWRARDEEEELPCGGDDVEGTVYEHPEINPTRQRAYRFDHLCRVWGHHCPARDAFELWCEYGVRAAPLFPGYPTVALHPGYCVVASALAHRPAEGEASLRVQLRPNGATLELAACQLNVTTDLRLALECALAHGAQRGRTWLVDSCSGQGVSERCEVLEAVNRTVQGLPPPPPRTFESWCEPDDAPAEPGGLCRQSLEQYVSRRARYVQPSLLSHVVHAARSGAMLVVLADVEPDELLRHAPMLAVLAREQRATVLVGVTGGIDGDAARGCRVVSRPPSG